MRNSVFIFFICCILGLVSCTNQSKKTGGEYNVTNPESAEGYAENNGLPIINFEEFEFNLGTIIQGEKVSHVFVFENTGKGNLIISNVKASCGCTVPKWTKEPIKPGQKGNIELVFDSSNREGKQIKSAKVYSNTQPNVNELTLRCEIIN